ncbi:MAG: hypothetical protein RLZZ230_546 [Candidatus Parcubacteria bacterium]|jgi:hypothetical protein
MEQSSQETSGAEKAPSYVESGAEPVSQADIDRYTVKVEKLESSYEQRMTDFEDALAGANYKVMDKVFDWLESSKHHVMNARDNLSNGEDLQPREIKRFVAVLVPELLATLGSSADTYNKWAAFPELNKFAAVDELLLAIKSKSAEEAVGHLDQASSSMKPTLH